MARLNWWRYAARSLSRRPGFALLALGATTVVFSIVNGALLRPLPFGAPDQLVLLRVRANTGFFISISMPNYRDLRNRSRSLASLTGVTGWNVKLSGRGPAEIVNARAVHGDLFGTLGIQSSLGRGFTPDETPDHPGGAPVVVLGHSYWENRFGADSGIVGQSLTLGGLNYTVIGVLPAGLGFPSPEVEVYFPLATLTDNVPWDDRDSGFGTDAIARLRPGTSFATTVEDLVRVSREIKADVGPTASSIEPVRLSDWYLTGTRTQLWILLGAVGFVLLIAIANIGNLLLARGEERHRELAVRTALGAGRSRLVGLLLGEAMLIAVAGGALGTGLAFAAVRAILPALPAEIPLIVRSQIGVDSTVLLMGLALALLAGLVFGLLPAVRFSRVNLASSMGGGRSATEDRGAVRAVLVVAEMALALILMVGAGLTLKSLGKLIQVDKGFDARNVLTGAVSPTAEKVATPEQWRGFYRELRERMQALPGVRSAAATLLLPLANRSWELRVHPEGIPVERATGQSVLFNVVSPEYFETMGLPILRGRAFTAADREGGLRVVIVDETMGRRFWPDEDPLGKRITLEETEGNPPGPVYRTVVGVVKNLRHYELLSPSRIQAYVPLDQSGQRTGMTMRVVLRTEGNPRSLEAPFRKALGDLDPGGSFYQIRTLEEYMDRATAGSRALTRLLTGFGASALGLAGLGIFGVVSYSVTRRTREIGIRMALGADAARVLRLVGGSTLPLILAGLGIGTAAAAGLSRVLRRALFEVSPLDLSIYLGVAGILVGAAVLAAWFPARRASRIDPAHVMREE
ncbi:MAG: ABC transporter permease [Gemmatimonadales bacterium]